MPVIAENAIIVSLTDPSLPFTYLRKCSNCGEADPQVQQGRLGTEDDFRCGTWHMYTKARFLGG